MEPVEEVKSQLFYSNGIPNEHISQFSCDHVIRKENLLPMTLAKVRGICANLDLTEDISWEMESASIPMSNSGPDRNRHGIHFQKSN